MAAENTATFAIDFDTQGATRGADAATGSLKQLGEQIDEDSQALAGMQKALRNLQGGTSVNIKAFQDLKKQIEAKKATLAQTQEKFLQLGGTFRKTKKPADESSDAMKKLFEQMQRGGGPLGGLASKLGSLRGMLAGGGALVVGAVAFAGALIAVAAAAAVATVALLKYGIAAADAYRSERLQLEGLTKVRNWYGIAAGSAGDLQSAIDNVSGSSALGREQINGMATSLYKLNLRGAALEQALEGIATATSAAGAEQGAFYQSLYVGAARSGVAIKKVWEHYRYSGPGAFPVHLVYTSGAGFDMGVDGVVTRYGFEGVGLGPVDWAHWKLVYEWPTVIDDDGLWDDPGIYGDGGVWDSELTLAQVTDMRLIPAEWNNGYCIGHLVVLSPGEALWDVPVQLWDASLTDTWDDASSADPVMLEIE